MTPAKKKAAPKPANIKAKNATRDAIVDTDDGRVAINWPANCGGGSREFTPEDLREAIDMVERVASFGDDVWFNGQDTDGREYYCRINNGRFEAHDHVGEELPHVSWSLFKRALEARIKS